MKFSYKNTLNLPKTNFLLKPDIKKIEQSILYNWDINNIYKLIRLNNKNNKKTFFIHDGPPYANGDIHMGHVVNKILKDIITKYKNLIGFNSIFIPGWDCHGLPIELKINNILKKINNNKIFFLECEKYVNKQINNQRNDFIRLGIIADWKNPYLTMDNITESNIIKILKKLFNNGYIKRYKKPINWCTECETNVSELEIIRKNTLCKSLYINYKIIKKNEFIKKNNINIKQKIKKIFLISWTTTPWTILDTQLLSINSKYLYSIILIENNLYILLDKNKYIILNKINCKNYKIIKKILGKYIIKEICKHPINNSKLIVIENKNVEDLETGITNIAPGHNIDDYKISIEYNIKPINSFDKFGFYKNINFSKKNVSLKKIIKITIYILKKKQKLFHYEEYIHKYPFCLKHENPIIFRLTYQWFMNLNHNNLKLNIIKNINNTNWIPKWGKDRIIDMINKREDWCISRQRKWGIPITFYINKKTNKPHKKSINIFNYIIELVKKNGIKYWWDKSLEEKLKLKYNLNKYYKSKDILDVWFESGTSFISTILYKKRYKKNKSDLCLEGYDQYRGWFSSSIIIFSALMNNSPFKCVITHGFVLDNFNRKMSKSIGNITNPKEILQKYNTDIIRLWVSLSDYNKDIKLSKETFDRVNDIYTKIRNTIKFLLSNIYDFDFKKDFIEFKKLVKIDQWIISKVFDVKNDILHSYENYNFNDVINNIFNFISYDLCSIYIEVIKDRLYTFNKDSIYRKSAQNSIYIILKIIIKLLSPILSFLSEEVYGYIYCDKKSIFLKKINNKKSLKLRKNEIFNYEYWNVLLKIKRELNIIIEKEINNKNINTSLELNIILFINDKLFFKKIKLMKNEIKFMFIISSLKIKNFNNINKYKNIIDTNINYIKIKIINFKNNKKCFRCWNYYNEKLINKEKKLCNRCIINIKDKFGEIRNFI